MNKKIPADIHNLLEDFTSQMTSKKSDLIHGVYLYGSVALGAYDSRKSDIDFITLLTRPCTAEDLNHLDSVHKAISQIYPNNQLDAAYLQADDIGKLNENLNPYPYYDGAFHPAGYYDVNHVTWWTLKHHGMCIYGQPLNTESITVDWQTLVDSMHHNLNSYWQDWASNPEKHKLLIHDGAIEWAVLGILRQYYSFREDNITSKIGAGEYALKHLPEGWHPLIEDALNIRKYKKSLYEDTKMRREMVIKFLDFIIAQSNAIYHDKY